MADATRTKRKPSTATSKTKAKATTAKKGSGKKTTPQALRVRGKVSATSDISVAQEAFQREQGEHG